jgi:hypothetical protein
MSDTKKIKINPNIFKITQKTNKNKTVKAYQPVSPNLLRNKFIQNVLKKKNDTIQKNSSTPIPKQDVMTPPSEANKYTNEFKESIEYLQMLSNENKHKAAQIKKENEKKNVLKELQKTIRAPTIQQYNAPTTPLRINLELPNELKNIDVKPDLNIQDFQTFGTIYKTPSHYNVDNTVPYGCLKGGFKKTYKAYKNISSGTENNHTTTTLLAPPTPPSEREIKLNKIKETILLQSNIKKQKEALTAATSAQSIPTPTTTTPLPKTSPPNPATPTSRKIKTTTLRKFMLGKSKTTRSIGVLIKNNNTKRNVIHKMKELKHLPLKQIKEGLQKSNLIKCGSNAPNDVLRKMYESSILAGDIINVNKDLILHNLANEKNSDF